MRITIKLFANFRVGRFFLEEREDSPGTTIDEVARALGLVPKTIGITMLNGRHAPLDWVLQDGDVLALFPLIGGG